MICKTLKQCFLDELLTEIVWICPFLDMITHSNMNIETTEGTDLYAATETMLNFPIRPCKTTNAHSLQLRVSQLPVHLHAGLKRCMAQTLEPQNYKNLIHGDLHRLG